MKLFAEAAAVGAGGFAGAIARHLIIGAAGSTIGILTVNVVGCLLFGLLSTDSRFTLFAATGFLGAMTTFSTFSGHTVKLWHSGETVVAVLFIAVNIFAGIAAFLAGMALKARIAG